MPTSKNWSTIGVMTVGVSSNQNDVGGSAGEHQNQLKAHGGSFNDRLVQLDGIMNANMACTTRAPASRPTTSPRRSSVTSSVPSPRKWPAAACASHHSEGRREPLQRRRLLNFANDSMQGQQRRRCPAAQQITTADSILKIYDASGAFGGPLKKDSVWF